MILALLAAPVHAFQRSEPKCTQVDVVAIGSVRPVGTRRVERSAVVHGYTRFRMEVERAISGPEKDGFVFDAWAGFWDGTRYVQFMGYDPPPEAADRLLVCVRNTTFADGLTLPMLDASWVIGPDVVLPDVATLQARWSDWNHGRVDSFLPFPELFAAP